MKFDEIRVNIYYTAKHVLIDGLNLRFKHETLDIKNKVEHLVNLDIKIVINDIKLILLNKYFHISTEALIFYKMTLLKQI